MYSLQYMINHKITISLNWIYLVHKPLYFILIYLKTCSWIVCNQTVLILKNFNLYDFKSYFANISESKCRAGKIWVKCRKCYFFSFHVSSPRNFCDETMFRFLVQSLQQSQFHLIMPYESLFPFCGHNINKK